ncbi:hypothetical protein I540_0618 [Mycobacteroides abscessus subsp. bolletii 1513]|uniref:Uncharacterized protein n=1 Tax=Mycobacteroides abscessus subsp. bolletii 1513 TaxID=1299321 RepID=X8E351_9MYCO|nr:hypothetical protein I540_0618 [Mycobacteroides abscessus subsp. bolletii 1513]
MVTFSLEIHDFEILGADYAVSDVHPAERVVPRVVECVLESWIGAVSDGVDVHFPRGPDLIP